MDIPSKDLAEGLRIIQDIWITIPSGELSSHYMAVMNDIEKRYKESWKGDKH